MNHLDDRVHESLDRLVPARAEQPDWEDVLMRLQPPAAAVRSLSTARRRRSWWLVPIAAAAAASAAALLLAAPWTGGPSIVAKASAAISPGSAADVLHERASFMPPFVATCLVGGKVVRAGEPHCPKPSPWSIELWVGGGTGQRSFRAITRRPPPRGASTHFVLAAVPFGDVVAGTSGRLRLLEIGGSLGPAHVDDALVYQRYSNTLLRFTQAPTAIPSDAFDPVALVRRALATGHAHVMGDAVVDGREVRAIDVRLRDLDGHPGSATYYVDRTTYAPVEIVYHHVDDLRFPYVPVFDPGAPSADTVRFSTFERLSATADARALTDIRAQHPTAKVVCGQEFGLPDC